MKLWAWVGRETWPVSCTCSYIYMYSPAPGRILVAAGGDLYFIAVGLYCHCLLWLYFYISIWCVYSSCHLYNSLCFCTSDAFHSKIRNDGSEQVCAWKLRIVPKWQIMYFNSLDLGIMMINCFFPITKLPYSNHNGLLNHQIWVVFSCCFSLFPNKVKQRKYSVRTCPKSTSPSRSSSSSYAMQFENLVALAAIF